MKTISSKKIKTSRLNVHYLATENQVGEPLVFIHGNASSSIFWKRIMQHVPDAYYAIAPDLRGFGDTEDVSIDATNGMGDFVADILSLLDSLSINKAHFIGHSMGGSVLFALMGAYPEKCLSCTLVNPGSPYGFGGTKDIYGTPHWPDFAGSGAGVVNPEFARRISIGDRSEEDPQASPRVVMNNFYWKPPFRPENEEELLDGLLSEKVGPQKYPGDFVSSENWPNTAPGKFGPANALSPAYVGETVSKFIENASSIPILWIRGENDQIVSDQSLFDLGYLGLLGFIPGYPGEEIYPPQPMVSQTKQVLESWKSNGGTYQEIVMPETGHTPFIEKEEAFKEALFSFLTTKL